MGTHPIFESDFDCLTEMRYLNEPVDRDTFEKKFLAPLVPVVFGPWLTKDWKARVTWVKDGKLDTRHMSEKYGTEPVSGDELRQADLRGDYPCRLPIIPRRMP